MANWLHWFKRFRQFKRDEEQHLSDLNTLRDELEFLGFDIYGLYSNPLRGIGSALQIAKEMGITIHRGTCYSNCCVSLPKEHWKYPLREDADDSIINPWLRGKRKPDDVKEINCWGPTVEIAIAQLLISCRKAGVI